MDETVMQVTTYVDINDLLGTLVSNIHTTLDQKLVGVYLYGSLVWGDFDYESSDIDLLVATASDIDGEEFNALQRMQADFIATHRRWRNRLEVAYISLHALQTFKTHRSQLAIISPGEPFHLKDAGHDWLMNWFMVQEKGITLFGPSAKLIIDPISKEEFIQGVKEHAHAWREYVKDIKDSRPSQAYAILTLCRALYTYTHGEQVSKKQAALWTQKQLPEWASLIQNALLWREAWRDDVADPAATFPETLRFVQLVIARITA